MSYYDDEEEQGRPQGGQGQQGRPAGLRADFRADPGLSPRASYQPRQPQDQAPQPGYQSPHVPHDPYADQPDPYVDPEPVAAGYRAPAPDPYYDPYTAQDSQYEGYEGGYEEAPPRRRGIINAAIVAGGLAVFGGIIFYAYNQGMRAGTESVAPILRADNSPTKIKPENPGGLEVPNQDKLIYDRLNPGAGEGGQVERLLPPPEAPMQRPQAEPALPPELPEDGGMPMAEAGEAQVTASAPPQPLYPPPQQQQPAYQPTTPAAPPPQYQPQQQAPAVAPPVQQTRPQQQPQNLTPPPVAARPTPAPTPVPAPPPAAATTTPKPTTGTVRVQVAAVDAEGKAAAEWGRLQRKFPELAGLSMRTVRADLGAKGIFYRIQGGPVDEARAKQICAALAAQGAGCVLVR